MGKTNEKTKVRETKKVGQKKMDMAESDRYSLCHKAHGLNNEYEPEETRQRRSNLRPYNVWKVFNSKLLMSTWKQV